MKMAVKNGKAALPTSDIQRIILEDRNSQIGPLCSYPGCGARQMRELGGGGVAISGKVASKHLQSLDSKVQKHKNKRNDNNTKRIGLVFSDRRQPDTKKLLTAYGSILDSRFQWTNPQANFDFKHKKWKQKEHEQIAIQCVLRVNWMETHLAIQDVRSGEPGGENHVTIKPSTSGTWRVNIASGFESTDRNAIAFINDSQKEYQWNGHGDSSNIEKRYGLRLTHDIRNLKRTPGVPDLKREIPAGMRAYRQAQNWLLLVRSAEWDSESQCKVNFAETRAFPASLWNAHKQGVSDKSKNRACLQGHDERMFRWEMKSNDQSCINQAYHQFSAAMEQPLSLFNFHACDTVV